MEESAQEPAAAAAAQPNAPEEAEKKDAAAEENKEAPAVPQLGKQKSLVEDVDDEKIDQMRKEWTEVFLKNQGFEFFLHQFMDRDIGFMAEDNSNSDVLFQKKYLGFISKILRVFLNAAQNADQSSLALKRKMSSIDEKSKIVDEEGQRFKEMTQIMEGPLGHAVIDSVDPEKLQVRALSLLQMVVSKVDVSYEDFVILSHALALWSKSFSSQPKRETLTKQFFASTVFKPEDFIFKGVYYAATTPMGKKVRQEISANLAQMCSFVKDLAGSPLQYYLDELSTNLPKPGAGNSLEFYDLLCDLVSQSFDATSKAKFTPEVLLNNAIANMKRFQSCEDHLNLMGCLKIIKTITEGFPMSKVESICQGQLI